MEVLYTAASGTSKFPDILNTGFRFGKSNIVLRDISLSTFSSKELFSNRYSNVLKGKCNNHLRCAEPDILDGSSLTDNSRSVVGSADAAGISVTRFRRAGYDLRTVSFAETFSGLPVSDIRALKITFRRRSTALVSLLIVT